MELSPLQPDVSVAEALLLQSQLADRHGGESSKPILPHESRKQGRIDRRRSNRVLMLGHLRELALYRAEVLQHHGFRVRLPDTEDEALAIVESGDFDVAVLSYTLPDTTAQRIAESVREYCPECPIIAIVHSVREDRRIAPDAVVIADNGPGELLSALRKVLAS
ncbi:MAG: hypothetical protein ACR2IF_17075 [Terriglobales bacterium]